MSEPTPREEARPKTKAKRLGPLPWWGWGLIAAAVVAGVIIWRRNSAASQAQQGASVGAPETTVPVPTGTGLTGSQYAALASQNAAIFEAIQDMQGPPSEPKDRDTNRRDEDSERGDRDDRARTTTRTPQPLQAQQEAFGAPSHGVTSTRRKPRKTTAGGNNPPIYK